MTGWRALSLLPLLQFYLLEECRSESAITAYKDDFGLAPVDPEIADTINWNNHPCRRECKDGARSMDCYYTFKLESYYTMSKACYDCPMNISDCFRPHCVPADGVKRPILVVNRQMPGPAIEVCQGDRVIVDVANLLQSESTTMHWHGQHHTKTPYMDGVPYVSQCPIPPGATFRYDYVATEAGTHFWHSHMGLQRGDGVFGPLIVRVPPSTNWHKDLYDSDEHTMVVLDWTHEMGIDKFLAHHHSDGENKAPNLLVNGLGRYRPLENRNDSSLENRNDSSLDMPLATFLVKPNLRYRFRLINAEFLNCPIEVSVDNHTLYVVSSDGRDVEPVEAESLVSYAGERFDFIVETNQEVGNYWIRLRGLMDCDERFLSAHQAAILRYEGAPQRNPDGEVTYAPVNNGSGLQVNALNKGTETNASVSMPMLSSMDENDLTSRETPDHQFYISYDFYKMDNPHFHRKNLYGFYQVRDSKQRLLTPQLNHISMKLPPFPLVSQRDQIAPGQFCNSSTVRGCVEDYCACTHVLQVATGSLVEVVLVDEGVAYDANHPFHLHGYQFRVVAMERVGTNITVDEVKRLDAQGLVKRKLDRAPLKDTVTVPDGGYTIIRFVADNPGYWLFHCHIEFHAELGMALVFKVGQHDELPPVPRDFPRCGDWSGPTRDSPDKDAGKRPANTLPEVTTGTGPDADPKENEVQENDLALIKLLPIILRELRMTSSSSTSSSSYSTAVPFALLYSCLVLSVVHNFLATGRARKL